MIVPPVPCQPGIYHQANGLTLIEMLAVMVLVSMIASVTAIHLAASSDVDILRATTNTCRDLDARARLCSQHEGQVVMSLDDRTNSIRLHLKSTGELLSNVELPKNIQVKLQVENESRSIEFDSFGRSPGYTIEFASGNTNTQLQISGSTGWVTENKQ